ncbi:MAG: hypothetical protein AAF547_09340 [Actinomycetota bacterium]
MRTPHLRTAGPAALALGAALLLAACVDDSATPIEPGRAPIDLTDVTHTMEPTPEMQDAAEQQCLDDPELAEGYVRAVDPDTDAILAELTLPCSDVRG